MMQLLWVLAVSGGIAFLSLLSWRFGAKRPTTFGSARWSDIWVLFKAGMLRQRGLRIGDWTGRLGVFYDGAHALTFGPTGEGKGVCAILPNLLAQRFVFLVDPGGENTAVAIKRWRDAGYEIGCINFFGEFPDEPWALPAHGFNPLDFLDVNSKTLAADTLVLAEMLTPRRGNESGSAEYFKNAAESAKRAMLLHIKTAEPAERQNLATLYSYVYADAAGWENLLAAMQANTACDGLVAREASKLERIETQAGEEFSAVMSTIQQDLSFLADPLVREKFSRSDVDFSLLKGRRKGQRGGIISVILPLQYIETHAAITRLAMACAILELQRKPSASSKVTFLIDEAAALGKITRFPNWLATLRKYRVSLWTIWQNFGQINDLYGRNAQTILGNCGLLQILGINEIETAELIEKLLGKHTVRTVSTNGQGQDSFGQTGRSLLMSDELLRFFDERQIVLIGKLWPIALRKTAYWQLPKLAGRFNPNPFMDGEGASLSLADRLAATRGRLFYLLVWWMAPHPVAAIIILTPLMLFGASLLKGGLN